MRALGRSDFTVGPFGLGCGPLGGVKAMADHEAQAVLEAAWSAGIRHFDTAPWYGNTQSEHRVGRFLRQKPRSTFTISTKVGRLYTRTNNLAAFEKSNWRKRWPGGLPFVPHFDFTHDAILRSYEDSLQRLGLPSVDGLAIHDLDTRHQKTEEGVALGFEQLDTGGGYRALMDLKEAGEIRAIGAGINFAGLIPRFLERFDIDYFILAMPYTLLDQRALDVELPLCEARQASVLIGAPFASGILATGAIHGAQYAYQDAPREILERVSVIEKICAQHGVELPAAALQMPLGHPSVVGVIPGSNTPDQLRQNFKAMNADIPSQFWDDLKSKGLLDPATPIQPN